MNKKLLLIELPLVNRNQVLPKMSCFALNLIMHNSMNVDDIIIVQKSKQVAVCSQFR